jgi:hypothetical protein
VLPVPVPTNPGQSQSAQGLSDIVIRSKIALTSQRNGEGAAAAIDVSLPTGDEEELLGRGVTTARILLLASKALGRASAYGNGGYTFGTGHNEAQYVAGIEAALLPGDRLTAAVSFMGRSLRDAASLTRIATVRRVANNLGENLVPHDVVIDRFVWSPNAVTFNRLSTEFKLHLGGQWLATGAVLFALNEKGLQPKPVPFVGLEWAGGER